MKVKAFFDEATSTLTYVVWDALARDAVIIDPVMDYDQASSTYSFESVEKVVQFIKSNELKTHYIIETHAHADHLSGSQELKRILPQAKSVIGREIVEVQQAFKELFHLENFAADGSQFDVLVSDGEIMSTGSLRIKAIHTPGHTPACYSFQIGDAVFTGDALFMPDFGVARCDFPKGSAETLYDSVMGKLYRLPEGTKVYTGHDYQPNGRDLMFETTIGESKKSNIHLKADTSKEEFVKFRTARDKTLAAPRLLLPSVQINIDAGALPLPEENGLPYIKLPMRRKDG